MPKNKNAQYRYKVLDKCLKNKNRNYALKEIVDRVNNELDRRDLDEVSERTIRQDIHDIEDLYEIEVKYNATNSTYCYADPNFAIYDVRLTDAERSKINYAAAVLRSLSLSCPPLKKTALDLEDRFDLEPAEGCIVVFDNNELLAGLNNLDAIIAAATQRSTIRIKYKAGFGEPVSVTVSPYIVKQYNNRWFLFGLNHDKQEIWNFALDRIVEIHSANARYQPTETDFATYFDHVVGVSVPGNGEQVEHVVLRFEEHRLKYVLSKPIHRSQQQDREGNVTIDVIPTPELEQQLLGFGPDVEVLAPESLRRRMAEKISLAARRYVEDDI